MTKTETEQFEHIQFRIPKAKLDEFNTMVYECYGMKHGGNPFADFGVCRSLFTFVGGDLDFKAAIRIGGLGISKIAHTNLPCVLERYRPRNPKLSCGQQSVSITSQRRELQPQPILARTVHLTVSAGHRVGLGGTKVRKAGQNCQSQHAHNYEEFAKVSGERPK
ncbi:hypothetical protein [uncultured Ruegeria sp.]|uniref:hypothetical protein n=1 Tax=uncultured Ruegeria sp. TaxID=259304 RepID=UPI00260570B3|nr:hypothetical protein [uncultured Ruegeria sp.]